MKQSTALWIVRISLFAALLGVVVLLILYFPESAFPTGETPAAETEALAVPEDYEVSSNFTFTAYEEAEGVDGTVATLKVKHQVAEYAGKAVAVTFWSSWSAASRKQLAVLEEAQSQIPQGSVLLPVNVGKAGKDSYTKASIAMQDGGYTFPLYSDASGVVTYNVTSTPQTYFLSPTGRVTGSVNGFCDLETLLNGLKEAGEE